MATFSKNLVGHGSFAPPLATPMPATRDTFRMKYDVKAFSSNVQVPLLYGVSVIMRSLGGHNALLGLLYKRSLAVGSI